MALEVAGLILRALKEIFNIADEMEHAGRQAERLVARLRSIERPVRAIQDGLKSSASEALQQVIAAARN